MALLYGRVGRFTAKNGGFRPGQGSAVAICFVNRDEHARKWEHGSGKREHCPAAAPPAAGAQDLFAQQPRWRADGEGFSAMVPTHAVIMIRVEKLGL